MSTDPAPDAEGPAGDRPRQTSADTAEASVGTAMTRHDNADNLDSVDRPDESSRLGALVLVGAVVLVWMMAGWHWLVIIAGLAVVLFLHELGHYVAARSAGMRVTEFFIGFGPRLWSFTRGETTYGIKAIWAGAYVRIPGMNSLDKVDPAEEVRSFRRQSYPKKMAVLLAGPGVHFVLAVVLMFAVFSVAPTSAAREAGLETAEWTLGSVSPHSPAEAAGLLAGDRLVSVGGLPVGSFADFRTAVLYHQSEEATTVVFERDGAEQVTTVSIGERLTTQGARGINGLIAGDRILQVEGLASDGPPRYQQVAAFAATRLGEPLDITIANVQTGEREVVTDAAITELIQPEFAVTGFFGVTAELQLEPAGAVEAAKRTLDIFPRLVWTIGVNFPRIIVQGFGDALGWAFGGSFDDPDDLGLTGQTEFLRTDTGPSPDENRILSIYGVAALGAEAASAGWVELAELMLLVNVFLGLFNLLPVLPFDGGHAAVATYERLRSFRGRSHEADARKLLPLTYAVVGIVALVAAVALVRDIVDPVNLG